MNTLPLGVRLARENLDKSIKYRAEKILWILNTLPVRGEIAPRRIAVFIGYVYLKLYIGGASFPLWGSRLAS